MTAALGQTPSQTVGPFFHDALVHAGENIVARVRAQGERIVLTGRVLDVDRTPLPDALVEVWQADAAGVYAHAADPRSAQADPEVRGFGRSSTDHPEHTYRFETIKPGRVAAPNGGWQAPHVCLRIFARGLLTHLHTRLYFGDEAAANARDPVLAQIDPARHATLVAERGSEGTSVAVYRLDVVLQGEGETVFFEP